MKFADQKKVEILEVHAEGEVGQIVLSGVPNIPGETLLDQMNYINECDDSFLKFCLHEPRGKSQMTVNLLLPSKNAAAEYGFIPMQPDGAHSMSGSNAISGIAIVGALLAISTDGQISTYLGLAALICATINVVGGFLVTDRMLKMFKKK